jgi:hypothetical protein
MKVGQVVIYKGKRHTVQAVSYWTTLIRPAGCAYGFHDFWAYHHDLQPAPKG